MNKNPLLSVIIPVYNVEKYLKVCLDSVLQQTYSNIEIICVDDASTDNSKKILNEYSLNHKIKIVAHKKNLGLFQTRISGINVAKGEYLAFVDGDDYVSVDWFRPLIKKATETNSDITFGNYVDEDNNKKTISTITRNIADYYNDEYSGKVIFEEFIKYGGATFYFHTMWDKIYKLSFFKDNLYNFNSFNKKNIIMTEDIAFNSVMLYNASKIVFTDTDCYFYCKRPFSSTSNYLPDEKIIKNVEDVIFVFDFLKNFLIKNDMYDRYKEYFVNFKKRYFHIWCNSIKSSKLTNNKKVVDLLLKGFEEKELEFCSAYEFHLHSLSTSWSDAYEKIKKQIVNPDIKVISFDLFSTLLNRPLWNPFDVFYFVQEKTKSILPNSDENCFSKMRGYSEWLCRKELSFSPLLNQDVTLTEIYNKMAEYYNLDRTTVEQLKCAEIDVETSLLSPRNACKELYELAKYLNKKIIIVSDMYIEKDTIENILKNNNYNYDSLFISSDSKKTKNKGSLYNLVIKKLKDASYIDSPEQILHIGDSYHNDIIKAKEKNIQTAFVPNTIDVFSGFYHETFNGNICDFIFSNASTEFDTKQILKELPLRCMYGVVANKLFDNPFQPFFKNSRYNGNPYVMGYFNLGIHIYSLAKWIYDTAKNNNYTKINFIARDGFLVKQVFDEIVKANNDNIKSDYVYITRKSILPYLINDQLDLFCSDNFINIYSKDYTYRKVLDFFAPISKKLTKELEDEYLNNSIILDETIGTIENYNKFIKIFTKISYDKNMYEKSKQIVKNYISKLFDGNTAAFDAGYSGRIQKEISILAEKPVDVLYIHDNGHSTNNISSKYRFKVHNYLEYSPITADILREIFISETTGSCIQYDFDENGNIITIFEKERNQYYETVPLRIMQKAALQFCRDYINKFKYFLDFLNTRNIESCYAFENFIKYSTDFDKFVFINYWIEDMVYSGFEKLSLPYRWNENLNEIRNNSKLSTAIFNSEGINMYSASKISRKDIGYLAMKDRSKFSKYLYYFIFEPKYFWRTVFEKRYRKKRWKK